MSIIRKAIRKIVFDPVHSVTRDRRQPDDNFVSIWQTTTPSETVTLPFYNSGTFNCVVYWGDGTQSTITAYDDADRAHTYTSAGQHKIEIEGVWQGGFHFNGGGEAAKILEIAHWGNCYIAASSTYSGCSNLLVTAKDIPTITTTTLGGTFAYCYSLVDVPRIGEWDVSLVTNFQSMFAYCTVFNGDVGGWTTTALTTTGLQYMFQGCNAFNQDISGWDTTGVTSLYFMFRYCHVFNSPLNTWDVSSVWNCNATFLDCFAFNQPLDLWDVSSFSNTTMMFMNAQSFNQDLSSWVTTSFSTVVQMFQQAYAFNGSVEGWDVTGVTDMYGFFVYANTFNQPLDSWNVSGCLEMNNMFKACSSFAQDLSGWDVSNVFNFSEMFSYTNYNHSGITSWDTTSATSMLNMFYNNSGSVFNQNLSGWNIANVTSMGTMFFGCTLSTANYDAMLINWESRPHQDDIVIHFGSSKYTDPGPAATARAALIADHNWTITDGGVA